ncbi:MAG: iron-containing alcohol dehydrogenase, partial [Eggerthellaceae bacterium]|nr:iron-containing alcohol dehydrogenase [Eggerthellaceae bacterium]
LNSLPYIIVATAPSMDGYTSATSSMIYKSMKKSIPSKAPNVIIGDVDIMKSCPKKMIKSGLGDILAKYSSVCDWRLGNLINGEYFCNEVAQIVRDSVKKCVDIADKLLDCDEDAIASVFEGLVHSGLAMNYVGLSRPASSVEHYFSHFWEMRSLAFNTGEDLHGIQCAIGTVYAAKIYDFLRNYNPDKEKACASVAAFDYNKHALELKELFGPGADAIIKLEAKKHQFDKVKHTKRLEHILANWDEIVKIINEEMPTADEIMALLDKIEAPKDCIEIGINKDIQPRLLTCTRDLRPQYVVTNLCWDLGVTDEIEL